jgi:hypothetical protein
MKGEKLSAAANHIFNGSEGENEGRQQQLFSTSDSSSPRHPELRSK